MLRLVIISAFACISFAWGAATPLKDGETSIKKHPYLLSVQENDVHKCTATLINNEMALMSAQCTNGKKAGQLKIRAGTSDKGNAGTLVDVEKICQHPRYDQNSKDYDVAVVLLSNRLILNEDIQPIKLHPEDYAVSAGICGMVAGWELFTNETRIEQANVVSLGRRSCENAYPGSKITDRMICYFKLDQECQGEYGSPLIVNEGQLGLVSWGPKGVCGDYNSPGVYTDLANPSIARHIQDCVEKLPNC